MAYIYYNPNPLGLAVGDCTIRAISRLIERDWELTYLDLAIQGYMMKDMPSANRVWGEFLRNRVCQIIIHIWVLIMPAVIVVMVEKKKWLKR